jgi:exosortase B
MAFFSEGLGRAKPSSLTPWLWPAILAAATLGAYAATVVALAKGPWQTEQEGHGPLIIAAAIWLVWQSRQRLANARISPAPLSGWCCLIAGLALMFLSRTQDVLTTESLSLIPVLVGEVLILGGWSVLRVLAFPIAFLIFAVPAPDWMIDAATVPLKVVISDAVTQLLYSLGYPIAQNGVMIMIGPYQLLVKDACSGMNSIFALSAIGVFYVYVFRPNEKVRGAILLALIIPITILANFIRVLALVLLTYYYGVDLLDGAVHDLTGIALFALAVVLLLFADTLLGLITALGLRILPSIGRFAS